MLVSVDEVADISPYNVSTEDIGYAQSIIETYVGRTEADVEDVRDRAMLARAVAYQTIYMQKNPTITFEQMAVRSLATGGTAYVFQNGDDTAPWIAPIAKLACKRLSWVRTRSVRTGRADIPWLPRLERWETY